MVVEKDVHKEEKSQVKGKIKNTADAYAKHSKIDWTMCAKGDKIIDANKRGKAQDITDKEFVLEEPEFSS